MMSFDDFLVRHAALLPEIGPAGARERRFPIRLPSLVPGRGFQADLVLPAGFPAANAHVQMSADAVLRIPHVDDDGKLCFSGDAGPSSGATPEERIDDMLRQFADKFYNPWRAGLLDTHFELEPRNYWGIHVIKNASTHDAIKTVYLLDGRPSVARVYVANLVEPVKWLLAGTDSQLRGRIISSLVERASQTINAIVAEIPVDFPFTPATWPTTQAELKTLLALRLSTSDQEQFFSVARRTAVHRVVLLSAPQCTYGFLLPGGPPTVAVNGKSKRTFPSNRVVPLSVSRIDPSWTYGRDQQSQVPARQRRHVLVCGAGALGSQIIDQLARAGVGCVSIVDPEVVVAANVGRHLLGVESIGREKAICVARHIARTNPACQILAYNVNAETWLQRYSLEEFDLVVDLTGEPDVRFAIERARMAHARPLLVGWMEPYVAAAHACQLVAGSSWLNSSADPLERLQAVTWPADVVQNEPGCGSQFQSYTAAAAAHAVALIAEASLELVDALVERSRIKSWVRGQRFLDAQYPGVSLKSWAGAASPFDGVILEREWNA